MKEIAIYQDEGVGLFVSSRIISELMRYTAPFGWQIRSVDAREIRDHVGWGLGLRLLVMPGGQDQDYMMRLGEKGREAIYRYVASGGAYLGICAGAYFAANDIHFTGPDGQVISGGGRLGLFSGRAVGPPPELPVGSAIGFEGAALAEVELEGNAERRAKLYFQGGPAFEPESSDAGNIEIIARYAKTGRIAALRSNVGLGVAVLCGAHPEVTGPALDEAMEEEGVRHRPDMELLVEELTEQDAPRRAFFGVLMRKLDIE